MTFRFGDDEVVIDPTSITFVERQVLRRQLGKLYKPDGLDEIVTLLWVTMRRSSPGLTWDDVAELVTVEAVNEALASS